MANIQDVGGLINLLRPLEEEGILVYRSRERLENEIGQFAVIERDGMILACAALYPLPASEGEIRSAEIACVAVDPSYRKSNRGSQILHYLEGKARSMGIQQLFVLTTRTAHWFLESATRSSLKSHFKWLLQDYGYLYFSYLYLENTAKIAQIYIA